ncbi:hypothetical protein [Prescottella equi]|jgi:hypothetical protein|uniref:Uncharacterized protein n=1 Tax=Rhodococcus hoagii TaxID=43767 RepID=A0AAE5CEG9_RHOHA|nr:hypothetical protein [Prescottella equi]MBM4653783.1 hypothetical protein [Prescottella equi]NKR51628.1 hypothetical protein [Prescottella equi]NKS25436.1 hypothetical protein [Prescottella equi]ORL02217.1 hypothetical protein A6F55_16550 [Prescottella equi]ORM02961.1 hypothetical protein A5N72_17455 [Prescottella equi]
MTTVSDNEAANAAAPDADPQTIGPAPTEPAADDAADQASDYSHGDPIRVFLYDIPNDGGEWTARYEQGITRIRAKKVSPGVYLDLLHRVFPKHEVLVKGELLSVKNRPHPDDPKVLTEVTLLVYLATEVALFKAFLAWAGGDVAPIRITPDKLDDVARKIHNDVYRIHLFKQRLVTAGIEDPAELDEDVARPLEVIKSEIDAIQDLRISVKRYRDRVVQAKRERVVKESQNLVGNIEMATWDSVQRREEMVVMREWVDNQQRVLPIGKAVKLT